MASRDVRAEPPVADRHAAPTWLDSAACLGHAALFDADDPEPALAVCGSCAVLTPCREWAVRTAVAGVAGGLTEEERAVWRAAHGIPEPRIDLVGFLAPDVVAADLANESLPDRHLRLVRPPP